MQQWHASSVRGGTVLATWTSYSAHRDGQSALSAHSAVLWNGHAADARIQAVACATCQTCMQPSLELKCLTQCVSHSNLLSARVVAHITLEASDTSHRTYMASRASRPRAWPWGGDAFAVLRCRSVLVMQIVSEHGMCVCGFLSCCVSVTRVLRSVMSDHLVGLTESSSARMPPTPPAFIAAPCRQGRHTHAHNFWG
jgi:hypothetical protein